MILILSFDTYEQGTDPIIDWLIYYNAKFIKLTFSDFIKKNSKLYFDIEQQKVLYDGIDLTEEIKVICYRRLHCQLSLVNNREQFSTQLNSELTNEAVDLGNYFFYLLRKKVWFPKPNLIKVNKLTVLNIAKSNGLKVPGAIVANTKQILKSYLEKYPEGVIVKPINHSSYFTNNEHTYFMYVNKITLDDLKDLPEQFGLTLFQQAIKADYEIRIFYLDGEVYCSAVLLSEEAKDVDIKLSFSKSIAHWVPFNLPEEIKSNLHQTMKALDLNTGSIDIIKDINGDYFFIEVNPVGQYGAGSHHSNYYIEKKIAEWLIKNDI